MGRSRSRSPARRDRRRSRSRERDRRRGGPPLERRKSRSPPPPRRRRSRSRSPRGRRSRSFSPRRRSRSPRDRGRADRNSRDVEIISPPASSSIISDQPELSEAQLEGKTEEEIAMMKTMGFCNFDTTKGKKTHNNEVYVANIQRKRRYRQYMNRKGGFNRPLDFIA